MVMIDAAVVKSLSKLTPWRSVLALLVEWFIIIVPLVFLYNYWNWFIYGLAIFWLGARQHSLAILMHEATHYRLFSNKFINDLVSELFLAYPVFISTFVYRKNHLAHHRNLNTEKDPDWIAKTKFPSKYQEWQFPQSKKKLTKTLVKDLCANYVLQILKRLIKSQNQKENKISFQGNYRIFPWLRLGYYFLMVISLSYFHLWVFFLLCWLIPFLSWTSVILRVRSIAEHFCIPDIPLLSRTRTTIPNLWDRLFVASRNIGYHTEHHLYPSVPYYNLPLIHELLKKNGYTMHITHSYLGVLKECVKIKN